MHKVSGGQYFKVAHFAYCPAADIDSLGVSWWAHWAGMSVSAINPTKKHKRGLLCETPVLIIVITKEMTTLDEKHPHITEDNISIWIVSECVFKVSRLTQELSLSTLWKAWKKAWGVRKLRIPVGVLQDHRVLFRLSDTQQEAHLAHKIHCLKTLNHSNEWETPNPWKDLQIVIEISIFDASVLLSFAAWKYVRTRLLYGSLYLGCLKDYIRNQYRSARDAWAALSHCQSHFRSKTWGTLSTWEMISRSDFYDKPCQQLFFFFKHITELDPNLTAKVAAFGRKNTFFRIAEMNRLTQITINTENLGEKG